MSDGEEFDAAAFRAEATGATSSRTTTDAHAAAEGTDPSGDVGSTSTLREMLMSTDPDRPLDTVESPWDPDRGGETRMFRGIMKMTDVDGLPAFADLVIGAAELATSLNLEEPDDQDDGATDQEVAQDFA